MRAADLSRFDFAPMPNTTTDTPTRWLRRARVKSTPTQHLRLFGSFDRFNYGDLLFPLVTRFALDRLTPGLQTSVYGLARSGLERYGALPSRSVADLYEDAQRGDAVLMAGGENLAQSWKAMLETLLPPADASKQRSERQARRILKGRHTFPYLLRKKPFRRQPRIGYNSCGGWPMTGYSASQQREVADALVEAEFVSVRETHTARLLMQLPEPVPSRTAPDCIFLLPNMWSREELERHASNDARRIVSRGRNYAVFQCHKRYGLSEGQAVAKTLRRLSRETALRIVLVSIGRMTHFEDHEYLGHLARELPCDRLPEGSVHDIAYTISHAKLFVGTSLHGVITSLAYGVRPIPLATPDPKLAHNLAYWRIPGLEHCTPLADVTRQATSLHPPPSRHVASLRGEVWKNFQALAEWVQPS